MRFLVDECTGPAVARWLEKQGFEVFSVYDEADDGSLRLAGAGGWFAGGGG